MVATFGGRQGSRSGPEEGFSGEGFLEVDAFTLDLEGQEGLDDAKIGGRDI